MNSLYIDDDEEINLENNINDIHTCCHEIFEIIFDMTEKIDMPNQAFYKLAEICVRINEIENEVKKLNEISSVKLNLD